MWPPREQVRGCAAEARRGGGAGGRQGPAGHSLSLRQGLLASPGQVSFLLPFPTSSLPGGFVVQDVSREAAASLVHTALLPPQDPQARVQSRAALCVFTACFPPRLSHKLLEITVFRALSTPLVFITR